jgi:hypothetical protein
MKTILATTFLICTAAYAQDPPAVSSGTLVANFNSDPSTMDFVKGTNDLTAWRAANNASIVLDGVGTQTENIAFDQDALDGHGALVVNDMSGQNRYLMGSIGNGLSNATIFWVGHFNPGQNGSIGDGSGQYIYDLGADGANGTQMDAQIDDGIFEIYGGSSTQAGANISDLNGVYSTWMTKFYAAPTTVGHEAYVNGTNLDVGTTSDGYQTDENLVLFAYQNSSGTGSSGYNFVGNIHQLLIYDGVLDEADTAAVTAYLDCKLDPNCNPPCGADFNDDGMIDASDLGMLLAAWGLSGATDLTNDGTTDAADLGLLLAGWGACS